MGQHSAIEWTHHTFNPWWGCLKVSPACTYCYAETWAKRVGQQLWGPTAPRRTFGDAHWREPLRWNRAAEAHGRRERVFCASMADVFEDRLELAPSRDSLFDLIEKTPHLDWLLLTKRPENIGRLSRWRQRFPDNVWLGTTVELQEYAAPRLDALLTHDAVVHFASCEPLLGPLDLTRWLSPGRLNWLIAGGESGWHARPMTPAWARALRDQCIRADVPFHFKQWGDWGPLRRGASDALVRLGKRATGRALDGHTWDGFPKPVTRVRADRAVPSRRSS